MFCRLKTVEKEKKTPLVSKPAYCILVHTQGIWVNFLELCTEQTEYSVINMQHDSHHLWLNQNKTKNTTQLAL